METKQPKKISTARKKRMERMKERRKMLELKQYEVERKAGFTKGYLTKLEKGHKEATLEDFEKLSEAFNVPVWWLIWGEPK